ncbi:PEPxxWA-CTERM sorting domain-containing protein [Sphingomonas sp. BIUV-7]|uniref:PEPxxWA-CTERM sorting domain-containing protein n=1 Tax=Sphingomonas natans TaxID=3063330 RepID=A0ABT8Y6D1_9SPHN|nr:PEPxxWA-CTERM sorting domain-containing protein [Sphingomonas sp. BIUV-7]MDO6413875.1 PEPxxWA-CTERM sorting domain-containing protein [Sphingomonas sp. BIUV-7]
MRLSLPLLCATALFFTGSAQATLIVSGDSNIFSSIADNPANLQFLKNIAGSSPILVQNSSWTDIGYVGAQTAGYWNMIGYSAASIGTFAEVTDADLAGKSLYLAFAPYNAFTTAEIGAMSRYLARGGTILITGENGSLSTLNNYVNDALAALGSGMRLSNTVSEGGYRTADIVTANAITAGTAGLEYAGPSKVTGGTGLYASRVDGGVIMAFEDSAAVPEPATWGMMVAGFGLIGHGLRRRRATAMGRARG